VRLINNSNSKLLPIWALLLILFKIGKNQIYWFRRFKISSGKASDQIRQIQLVFLVPQRSTRAKIIWAKMTFMEALYLNSMLLLLEPFLSQLSVKRYWNLYKHQELTVKISSTQKLARTQSTPRFSRITVLSPNKNSNKKWTPAKTFRDRSSQTSSWMEAPQTSIWTIALTNQRTDSAVWASS